LIIHRFIAVAAVVNNVQKMLEHCSDQCITVNVVHGNGEPDALARRSREARLCLAHPTRRIAGKAQPLGLATAVGWRRKTSL
jgi:hypothetical protein